MILKLLIAFVFSFGNLNTTNNVDLLAKSPQTTYVYVCVSETAKKYHYSKNCRGLNACTHEVRKVSITDAKKKYSRTLCGWED